MKLPLRQRCNLPREPVNLFVFGATRTGKTVCTGRNLLTAWLAPRPTGFVDRLRGRNAPLPPGLLALCVKSNEGDNLVRTVSRVGPHEEIIHVTPGSNWTLDPISAYFGLKGASPTEAAKLLGDLAELAGRFQGKPSEPFWELGKQRTLYFSLVILQAAFQRPTTEQLYDFLTSLPGAEHMLKPAGGPSRYETSFAGQTARRALEHATPDNLADLKRALDWLTKEWPFIPEKTRAGFHQGALNAAFPFLQSPVADLCAGNTLTPELLNQGYKIILDVPVIRWGLPALLWQGAVRYICDLAMLDRPRTARSVVKYADEYQWLAMPAHDARVATVSSESRYSHCFLSQSVQTMLDALGGTEHAKAQLDSILGNSVCKVFHWTDDEATQKLMAQLSGQRKEHLLSSSGGDAGYDPYLDATGQHRPSVSVNLQEHWCPVFKPEYGQLLTRAGLPHGYSEALVIEAGLPSRVDQIPMLLFPEA